MAEGKDENMVDEDMTAQEDEVLEQEEPAGSKKESSKGSEELKKQPKESSLLNTHIYALRTTANREDQVMDFVASNVEKKKLEVYSLIKPHGLRGYIFMEAANKTDAEQAVFRVPYARGIIGNEIDFSEIEHWFDLGQKMEYDVRKNDIAEIISGPFKREKCKITRVDKAKDEVVVELLEAAVPIPITLKTDAIKVIRREGEEEPDPKDN